MHRRRRSHGGWRAVLVGVRMVVGIGGLALVGGATVVPQASTALQVTLHPNHLTAKPGGGGSSASTVGWASSNWSGYAVTTTSSSPFTGVTANWTVPSARSSKKATYSAAWAGIDGFNNSSLIQTGTEQDYYNGSAHYAAWWTTSAQGFAEQPIAKPVSANDPMTATIGGSGTSWTMTLADKSASHPWSFTEGPITYTGPGASAEWIMEAPTVGGRIAPLANYSTLAFDGGTVNGAAPGLTANEGGEMVQGRQVVSTPSGPDKDAVPDGFAIAYGSTPPSAPTS
jgi:Peptidase A4 family